MWQMCDRMQILLLKNSFILLFHAHVLSYNGLSSSKAGVYVRLISALKFSLQNESINLCEPNLIMLP